MQDSDKLDNQHRSLRTGDNFTEPVAEKGWINTQDRISEILFGLIMALTFTCTISITDSDKGTVDEMLLAP
jgi:hypothetical protein